MKAQDLKKSILQYAMQGKLVPQDPNDEPASELLKRIKAEKEQFIKDGKIKKEKPLPPITRDEIPYELPQGWEWVRLGEVINYGSTGTVDNNNNLDENTWILDLEDIEKASSKLLVKNIIKNKSFNSSKKIFKKGDVLYGKLRPYLDKVIVAEEDGICTTEILPLRIYYGIDSYYLKWFLKSPMFIQYVNQLTYGVKMPRLGTEDGKNALLALPSLAEQKRIVEKLEEILPLVDEYGKNEEILSEMNQKLPKQIRQSILQYAVQGKLVEQNPQDEPASELLKRIKAEKEQLIKEGKIKKEKPLPPITQDEIPYDLPQGWQWVRLGEYTDIGTGTTPSTTNTNYYQGNIPWITSSSTGKKFIDSADKLITQEAINDYNLRIYPINTLIIALYGQGKTRGQISELLIPSAINQACAAINSINQNYLLNSYIKLVFQKQYEEIRTLAAGCAQPNLNVGKIKNTLIPIPPLAEQKRIVAKVEELLNLVNKLEEKEV